MNTKIIKEITPPMLWSFFNKIKKRIRSAKINNDFPTFILNSAIEYSKIIGGDFSSFDRRLSDLIKNPHNDCNSIIQDVLTAFMPKYEQNLYEYYKEQQYLIFYRFLVYPYISNLNGYIIPYEKGLKIVKNADILDYGCGIPYGLIYSLINNKKYINSITLIDLDLVHMRFVEFLIKKISPEIKLTIYKLRDAETFPDLNSEYNFFYGKDIFEHLRNPLDNLKKLLSYAKSETVCYFDLADHGEKIYQHVSPNITFLTSEMIKMGFNKIGTVSSLIEFIKK